LAQLVQHLLISLVVPADRAEPLAIFEGAGHGGQHEEHELHGRPPSPTGERRIVERGCERRSRREVESARTFRWPVWKVDKLRTMGQVTPCHGPRDTVAAPIGGA